MMTESQRALSGTRLIDLTDARAIYGAKLLSDLGADTVRPIPPEGDPLANRGPIDKQSGESLWYAFHTTSRRLFHMSNSSKSRRQLQSLCEHANVIVLNDGHPFESFLDLANVRDSNPGLVIVECTSFGNTGPWKDYLAPDLVAGALGGSVAITGDEDTPPLKPFGDVNFAVSGAYVAVAALAALRHSRQTGKGQLVRVSVHECIASCLEHVFMWYLYNDVFRHAKGKALERRGSLHWSNLYQVMQAKNGHIMVTPTPSLDNQLVWLIEENAFEDLLDPEYQEPNARGRWARRMMEVLRSWVATKDVESLFYEAQEHHAPFGWVHDIPQVADNPQLAGRDWWSSLEVSGNSVKSTGSPYSHSDTPAEAGGIEHLSAESEGIIDAIGWGN
ncbi:MAG: CoA transferase [Gammaproteobacteria bacterium]|nr:CoA transferase [Gammaproteobacteria bacterium]